MPKFIRMGLHETGYATRHHSARNKRRFAARRKVLPGFPWEGRFETREEIDDYLNGDSIVCLLCGKTYRSIGHHLRVHNYNEEMYRERYGLPWRGGLQINSVLELRSKLAKQRIKDGSFGLYSEEDRINTRKKAHSMPHREKRPYQIRELKERLVDINRSYDSGLRQRPKTRQNSRQDRRCSIVGCDRRHCGLGMCRMHLSRFHKHGEVGRPEPLRKRRSKKQTSSRVMETKD